MTGTPRIPCSDNAELAPNAHTAPANNDADAPAAKAALRKALAVVRSALDPHEKAEWDARLCVQVRAWWDSLAHPGMLGVYWPLRGEADLTQAYAALAQQGVVLALPVVLARDAALGFAEWVPGEEMTVGAMGVAVPAKLRMVARPGALLVPCLGFDDAGYRLGYGGGFYDRTLAALPRPATAGVAYSCLHTQFAHDVYDIALDLILTERA
ncbi:MAG: 5-formyltetrahydrofolate cyclo-ligase [Pseudomonadota bacterium]